MPRVKAAGLWKALWCLISVLCLGVAAYALRYFLGRSDSTHFARYIFPLRLHIAGGIGALLLGPSQFVKRIRTRNLNLHRWLGRFYLLSVALGATAGFAMAAVSLEGLPTHFGFGVLAVLWFGTGMQAYRMALAGRIANHREWMIRNFALTLAAVTLRIYLPLMLGVLHWSFRDSYIAVSWLCWVPNLLLAESLTRSRSVAALT